MQRYRAVILIIAFGVLPVVVVFVAALFYLGGEGQQAELQPAAAVIAAPSPEPTKVIAAARDLPAGVLVRNADLIELAVAPDTLHGGHLRVEQGADVARLRGYAVRLPLASGAALARSDLIAPWEQGFLAAVLHPGMRAVTIRVDPATNHAGLVGPGDRVDVILTAEISVKERERAVLARTIVENVRVVAADRWFRGETPARPAGDEDAGNAAAPGSGAEMVTATLEVSPVQGERLVIAEHEGRLSLALRPLAAASEPRSQGAPAQGETPVATQVRIYRGNRPAEVIAFSAEGVRVPAGTVAPEQAAGTAFDPIDALRTASEER